MGEGKIMTRRAVIRRREEKQQQRQGSGWVQVNDPVESVDQLEAD